MTPASCPACGQPTIAGKRFCADCGAPLPQMCGACGQPLVPGKRFCADCGAPVPATGSSSPTPTAPAPPQPPALEAQFSTFQQALPPSVHQQIFTQEEGENRVLTILFADLSGSTAAIGALAPEDAAALLHDVLRAMVEAIVAHGGRINQVLGDAVLAFFGTPVAHENDPERAIRAALQIREAVQGRGLRVTAGINSGEVYLGELGRGPRQDVRAVGSAVNLAARLQQKAQPGQILVGESVYRHTRRAFEFARSEVEAKGFAEPVAAYEVLRALPHPEKVRGIEGLRATLIGRDKELAALIDAADALVAERQGQLVTIVGEAGIGKTRLIAELKEYLGEKDVRWLEGRCLSIGQPVSFWPFIDLMRTYLHVSSEDGEEEMGRRLVESMDDLFGPDASGIIPYLGQMLSLTLEPRYEDRIRYAAPEQIRRQTLLRMRDVVIALARRRPLVLILEDVHWADDPSLDLLWVLMDELESAPLLLVCAYRPEREHGSYRIEGAASRKHQERYTAITLKPLTPRQSQQMVESLLDIHDLPEATKAVILAHAEGNPFFVEEVVRLLIERGVIYRADDRWHARESIGDLTVPDTIKSVILSRIDRLQGDVKYVLQCAAVIGRVFQRRLLEYLSGQSEALEKHLGRLEEHELIYKERIVPELEYAFKHALTQETAYEGILVRSRRAFHQRIGEGIEALYREQLEEYYELLAFHYSRSDDQEKAIDYLVKAGQKAADRYANTQALSYFGQALERTAGRAAEHEAILARRAGVLLATFSGKAAAQDYERLLAGARQRGDQAQELEALLGLGRSSYVMALDEQEGDYPTLCREQYQAAYDLARQRDDKRGMVLALIPTIWFVDFWRDYTGQADENIREALALSREIGDADLILDSELAMFRLATWRGITRTEGEDWSLRLLRQLESGHDLPRLKELYYNLMWAYLDWGAFERAIECCDAGIRLAAEVGAPPVQYPTLKALALVWLGRYGEAWEALQQEIADDEHPFGRAMKDLGTGLCLFEFALYDRAAAILREVVDQARRHQRAWMLHWAQSLLVQSLLRAGQVDDARLREIMQDVEKVGGSLTTTVGTSAPAVAMAEVSFHQGRLDEALGLADRSVSEAEQRGDTPVQMAALEVKLRILLALDRPSEAAAMADDALRMATEIRSLPIVWRLQAARAEALAMLGNTDAATQAYAAAAGVIRTLADSIPDATLRKEFLSNAQVASIMDAART